MKTFVALLCALTGCYSCAIAQEATSKAQTITVNVIGAVAKPLRYNLPVGAGALDALAAAGGSVDFAALKRAHILHHVTTGQPDDEAIDLKAVTDGKAKDTVLRDGDTLVVPEAKFGQRF